MFQDIEFDRNGSRLNFTWIGDDNKILDVYILDGHTKLIFYKTKIGTHKNFRYWVEATRQRAKHKIYQVYLNDELILNLDNKDGSVNISDIDYNNYMKDIGVDVSHELLAIPLYEIYVDQIYNHEKCMVKENDIVFDIGANIGLFTYHSIYKNCKKCYSFEPNKQLYEKIKSKNIQNLNVYNVAVSDKDEVENFYVSRGGISSCLEKDNNQIIQDGDFYRRDNDIFDKIEVNTISIMKFIKDNNINRIDFFKCDCEGSEYEIIDDLEEDFLKNNIDRFLIEYHYLHNPIFKEKYNKMLNKLIKCDFEYHNNSNDNIVNDGVLFLWKK